MDGDGNNNKRIFITNDLTLNGDVTGDGTLELLHQTSPTDVVIGGAGDALLDTTNAGRFTNFAGHLIVGGDVIVRKI